MHLKYCSWVSYYFGKDGGAIFQVIQLFWFGTCLVKSIRNKENQARTLVFDCKGSDADFRD